MNRVWARGRSVAKAMAIGVLCVLFGAIAFLGAVAWIFDLGDY